MIFFALLLVIICINAKKVVHLQAFYIKCKRGEA